MCLQPPPNCGQENARCCPPGIYGPPNSPRNVTGFSCEGKDIKCSGWGGMPGELNLAGWGGERGGWDGEQGWRTPCGKLEASMQALLAG